MRLLGAIILGCIILFSSCQIGKDAMLVSKQKKGLPTVFDHDYYQNLGQNVLRLYHLMQGTFTAYSEGEDQTLNSWTLSSGDSVILYIAPLGEVAKDGYWTYSYEFMTSLPNQPIYTSIKQVRSISRDTLEILYYKTDADIELADVLDRKILNSKINLDQLTPSKKRVVYTRASASNFIGRSSVYLDADQDCLRQNVYNISPKFYQVEVEFFDKHSQALLNKVSRPNFLVRRKISKRQLEEIANKASLEGRRR